MRRFIAFLRAINVGGRNVTMGELRELFAAAGFQGVETFIASGNVIFTTRSTDASAIQQKIETHLLKALGYEVTTFLRTVAQVSAVAEYKPFDQTLLQTAGALNVAFLNEPLTPEAQEGLSSFRTNIDDFHTRGREIYWLCKLKQSESKFSNAAFERRLKIKTTFRGLNTVARLAAKYST